MALILGQREDLQGREALAARRIDVPASMIELKLTMTPERGISRAKWPQHYIS
jgi:hypothetical protein